MTFFHHTGVDLVGEIDDFSEGNVRGEHCMQTVSNHMKDFTGGGLPLERGGG